MTDATAFILAIHAAPHDAAPRLVYADWLDERGDPRGEFIRVQVAVARMSPGDPGRDTLVSREAALRA